MLTWTSLRLLLGAAAALSAVGIIGTGIDARQGIFLQEVHQGEKTLYQIANNSDKGVTISVVLFDDKWRIGQPIGKVIAGPWEIPAKTAKDVDVNDLAGGEKLLWFFLADKSPLGVLHAPRTADSGADAGVRWLNGGLNGMGNYPDGIRIEGPKAPMKPGDSAVVRLHFSGKLGGVLKFSPPQPNPALGPELAPNKFASETVTQGRDGAMVVFDLNKPAKAADEHVIELTFAVPADHAAPIFTWNAWYANTMGGGTTLARAISVAKEPR